VRSSKVRRSGPTAGFDLSKQAGLLESLSNYQAFGSFHHQFLTLTVRQPRFGLLKWEDIERFIAEHPSIDDQAEAALESAAPVHELRHVHDCFGTTAGLTFYLDHIRELNSFVNVCVDLRKRDLRWKVPVGEWAQERSCPESVQKSPASALPRRIRSRSRARPHRRGMETMPRAAV
jgi:hypothetical protein